MLRWLRFLFYCVVLLVALVPNAPAIRLAAQLLTSPSRFAPAAPNLLHVVLLLGLATAYAVWLSGATVARWRMPLATHAIPMGLVVLNFAVGPARASAEGGTGAGPADRALSTMRALTTRLAERPEPACGRAAQALASLGSEVPTSGYRSYGMRAEWRVVEHRGAAVRSPAPGDGPGTIYVACEPDSRRFWVSAVVTETTPVGTPAMVRDGVGKVVTLPGEVSR